LAFTIDQMARIDEAYLAAFAGDNFAHLSRTCASLGIITVDSF
jgi:hypothetical protein